MNKIPGYLDYVAFSPKEEIKMSLQRTYADKLGHFSSLKGRGICVLRVLTHTTSIVLKPLFYLTFSLVYKLAAYIFKKISPQNSGENADFVQSISRNPELVERLRLGSIALSCLVVPISQTIQAGKALAGIVYPGFYFKDDRLAAPFKQLASIAKEVNCSPSLIHALDRGPVIIHKTLNEFPNKSYYYAQFRYDLVFIAEQLNKPEFSKERKHVLLSLLNPEPKGSGIESCPGGLGRILQQISINIRVPEEPAKIIPWLNGQFKNELLNQMVIQAASTLNQPNSPAWQEAIRQIAHDPAHRANALVITLGKELNLPEEIIKRAKFDFAANPVRPLLTNTHRELLQAFSTFYKEEDLTKCLLSKINSQPDGSAGLKNFRDHVIRELATKIAREEPAIEDSAGEAVRRYYLHRGEGNPSDFSFNDLNEQAIKTFSSTLDSLNPYLTFSRF